MDNKNYIVIGIKPHSSDSWNYGGHEDYGEDYFIEVVSTQEMVAEIIAERMSIKLKCNEEGYKFIVMVEGEPFGRFLSFPDINDIDSEDIIFDPNCHGEDNASFERQIKFWDEINELIKPCITKITLKKLEAEKEKAEKEKAKEREEQEKKAEDERRLYERLKKKYEDL